MAKIFPIYKKIKKIINLGGKPTFIYNVFRSYATGFNVPLLRVSDSLMRANKLAFNTRLQAQRFITDVYRIPSIAFVILDSMAKSGRSQVPFLKVSDSVSKKEIGKIQIRFDDIGASFLPYPVGAPSIQVEAIGTGGPGASFGAVDGPGVNGNGGGSGGVYARVNSIPSAGNLNKNIFVSVDRAFVATGFPTRGGFTESLTSFSSDPQDAIAIQTGTNADRNRIYRFALFPSSGHSVEHIQTVSYGQGSQFPLPDKLKVGDLIIVSALSLTALNLQGYSPLAGQQNATGTPFVVYRFAQQSDLGSSVTSVGALSDGRDAVCIGVYRNCQEKFNVQTISFQSVPLNPAPVLLNQANNRIYGPPSFEVSLGARLISVAGSGATTAGAQPPIIEHRIKLGNLRSLVARSATTNAVSLLHADYQLGNSTTGLFISAPCGLQGSSATALQSGSTQTGFSGDFIGDVRFNGGVGGNGAVAQGGNGGGGAGSTQNANVRIGGDLYGGDGGSGQSLTTAPSAGTNFGAGGGGTISGVLNVYQDVSATKGFAQISFDITG